ncbi:MAG: serine/threonine protein kinase [Planctomycetes bacterium]|nr:serine/threonine protein kinase [Planctomycetota bacterium]
MKDRSREGLGENEETLGLPSRGASGRHSALGRGSRLGGYVVEEEIGRGAMGVVYRARDTSLSRTVALKVLSVSGDEAARKRFIREGRAAAALKAPSIAQVYDVGEEEGVRWIAMQWIEGTSLAEEQLPLRRAVEVLRDVATAVHFAHTKGVVHRDLKPENILLGSGGVPYVTDFGLAKIADAETRITLAGVAVGTPSYMSPEQAAGMSRRVGPRSDVYSLGATLFWLLTGRAPFEKDNAIETMLAVRDEKPPRPSALNPAVPRSLEAICLRCLAKTPERRYASARSLAEDCARWLRGEEIGISKTTTITRRLPKAPASRARGRIVALSIGALAVATGIGLWLISRTWTRSASPSTETGQAREGTFPPAPPRPSAHPAWIRLENGSLLAADWLVDTLELDADSGPARLDPEKVVRVAPGREGPRSLDSVEMRDSVLEGRLTPGTCRFLWRSKTFGVPWSEVVELLRRAPEPAPEGPEPPGGFRPLSPRDFPADTRAVTFDRDGDGQPILRGADVETAYLSWGLVFDAEHLGTIVYADEYVVQGKSRGNSGAVRDPQWHGHVNLFIYVPGTVDPATRQGVPGGVHTVGVYVAQVAPGGTGLRAYSADGRVLREVLTAGSQTDFLGLESPVPIHRVEIFDDPRIDPNFTTDDWLLGPIVPQNVDPDLFAIELAGGERLFASKLAGDSATLRLSPVRDGPAVEVPTEELQVVRPPLARLRFREETAASSLARAGARVEMIGACRAGRIVRWDDRGVRLESATSEEIGWERILRIRFGTD